MLGAAVTSMLRPILCVIRSTNARHRLVATLQALWDVQALLFLALAMILWFGLVMFVVFRQFCRPASTAPQAAAARGPVITASEPYDDYCDESAYFGDLGLSMRSAFTILTTANFPDVMLSSYSSSRLFALPFMAFVIVGLFFLMNVILASVYASHKQRTKARLIQLALSRQDSLDNAFTLLLATATATATATTVYHPPDDGQQHAVVATEAQEEGEVQGSTAPVEGEEAERKVEAVTADCFRQFLQDYRDLTGSVDDELCSHSAIASVIDTTQD
eukprot:COSAG05_NODE_6353_length_976_cov_0.841505_1_plen_274_part_10